MNDYTVVDQSEAENEDGAIKEGYEKRAYCYVKLISIPPTIDESRRAEFPTEHDLIVALWEKVVEDRPESSDILQAKRVIVKEKFPK